MASYFYRKLSKNLIIGVVLALLFFGSIIFLDIGKTYAFPDRVLVYKGRLADSSGVALTDSSYNITFSIYHDASGGGAIWSESQSVTTNKGIFSAVLGSSNPINFDFNSGRYYLGIKVGADSEMTPRQTIGGAPFALNSQKLNGYTEGTGANNILKLGDQGQIDIAGYIKTTGTLQAGSSTLSSLLVNNNAQINGDLTVVGNITAPNIVYSVSGSGAITSTGGQNPTIGLSDTWGGQTSINTVGTITTGVWNGSPITDNYITALSGGSQGEILYHNGTSWVQLAPGTAGQYLRTGGSSGNPYWNGVSGTVPSGTVNNSILTWNSGIPGWNENINFIVNPFGTITSGTWNGSAITDNYIAALSGGAQGDILYHNGTNWVKLSAGASGNVLETQGAGANPQWIDLSLSYLPLSGGTMSGDIDMDWNDILNVNLISGNTSDFTNSYVDNLYVDNIYSNLNPTINYYSDINMNNNDITNVNNISGNTLNFSDLYVTNIYTPTTTIAFNGDLDMQYYDIYNVDELTANTITDGTMTITGGVITNATWNGNTIDISSYTNLAVSAPITLTGDTIGLNYNPTDFQLIGGQLNIIESNIDHGNLAGLSDDDHLQYALLSGRVGGQVLRGGTAAGDNLTFESTSNATKGYVIIQPNGGRVGIGVANPQEILDVNGAIRIGTTLSTNAGTIRWTGADFEGYNGSAWVSLTAGGGGTSYWSRNAGLGYIYPLTITDRVGIGTNTPSEMLDINGNATISGTLNAGATTVSSLQVTSFGVAGYVKNDASGNLSGGNSISAGDIPTSNLVQGTGVILTGTLTNRLVGSGSNVTIAVSSNVPTSVVNDTNVTGSIASNTLTLGWQGQLAVSRGGTGAGSFTQYGILYGNNSGALGVTAAGTTGQILVGNTGAAPSWGTASAIDHGLLSGLADDDHLQYALLAGRAGGQYLYGGTAASNNLTLESTSNGTKGYILLQPNGGNVGIGTSTPNNTIQVANLINFNNTDYNTQLGYQAGLNVVSGAGYNTYVGYQAGLSGALTTNAADANNAFGYQSLYANTTGYANNAFGYQALYSNTEGNANNAFGSMALRVNTTGVENSAFGANVLVKNTEGNYNSAFGNNALHENTTGDENAAFGLNTLYFNSEGLNNSAFGTEALGTNTTGDNNTAIGYQAGYNSQTGNGNVFLGYQAGYNETGSNKLYVANSSSTPLIYGEFDNNIVRINGNIGFLETGASPAYYTIFQGGDQSANLTYTWPTGYPVANGYALTSTTGGVLSWVNPSTFGTNYWTDGGTYLRPTNYRSVRVYDSGLTDYVDINHNGTDALMTFANTGLLNIDSNTFVVDIAGDNVGIGETAPSSKLEVAGEIELANYLYFGNTTAGQYFNWDGSNFILSNDLLPSANVTYDLGSDSLRWRDLYLDDSSIHLGVSGDEGCFRYNTTTNQMEYSNDCSTYQPFASSTGGGWTDDGTVVRLTTSSDTVGIGTVSPGAKLDVLRTTTQLRLSYSAVQYTDFTVNSTGDMTIAPLGGDVYLTGNLQPTSNDTYDLGSNSNRWRDIYTHDGSIHIGTNTGDEYTISYNTSGTNYLGFNYIGSGDPEMVIDQNGYVGIGTTLPSGKLHLAGNRLTELAIDYQFTIQGTDAYSSGYAVSGIRFVNQYNTGLSAGMGAIEVQKDNTTAGDYGGYMQFLTRTNGQAPEVRLRITSQGDLLPFNGSQDDGTLQIGDSSYDGRLHIMGVRLTEGPIDYQFTIQGTNAYNSNAAVSGIRFINQYNTGAYAGMGAIEVWKENTTAGDNGSFMQFMTRTNSQSPEVRLRISSQGDMLPYNSSIGDGTMVIGDSSNDGRLYIQGLRTNEANIDYQFTIQGANAYNSGAAISGIRFMNKYNSSGNVVGMGGIEVQKNNNTDGDYGGYMAFLTRANGGNASEKMRITSAGYLGINTTDPQRYLEVFNDTTYQLRVTRAVGAQYLDLGVMNGYIDFYNGDRVFRLTSTDNGANSANTELSTNTSGYLYVNPQGGRTGINRSDPSRALEVYNSYGIDPDQPTLRVTYQTGTGEAWLDVRPYNGGVYLSTDEPLIRLSNNNNPTVQYTAFSTNANGYFYINPQGQRTGIGRSDPNRTLEVYNSYGMEPNEPALRVTYQTGTGEAWLDVEPYNGGVNLNTDEPLIRLSNNDTPATRYTDLSTNVNGYFNIDPYGDRVGIVTSAPASTLAVNGNTSIGTSYTGNSAPTNGLIVQGNVGINTNSPDSTKTLHIKEHAYTSDMAIRLEHPNTGMGTGYADLGVANLDTLEIRTYHDSTESGKMELYNGTAYTHFETNSSGYLYINASGSRVGIGDSTPDAFFSVGSSSQFQVDSTGNIIKIRNVTYSWPSSNPANPAFLKNDGAGNLSWAEIGTSNLFYIVKNGPDSSTSVDLNNTTALCTAGDVALAGGGTGPTCNNPGDPACGKYLYIEGNGKTTVGAQEGWSYALDVNQDNPTYDTVQTWVLCVKK